MTKGCFESPPISTESMLLSVSVISGRHLNGMQNMDGSKRKHPTDTVVKVEIIGHPEDCVVGITKPCQVCAILRH